MSDEFLKYYNRELAYLRHKGQEFGEQYPKIASRLGISEEQVDDPHVERLLEGCAFMTARIRQSLDNSYPQFTESLMGQLHPDFHAPIPSMSIIKMKCNESTSAPFDVSKGEKVMVARRVTKNVNSERVMRQECIPSIYRQEPLKMPRYSRLVLLGSARLDLY